MTSQESLGGVETKGRFIMSGVTVRPARASDAPAICCVHQRAVRILCQADYTSDQVEGWIGARVPQDYVDSMTGGEHLWVAEIRGQVVGFAGIKGSEITAVYVEPREARQGIGGQLLHVVERVAAAGGLPCVYLDASLTAVPFYTNQGYQSVEHRTHRLRSGVDIACVRMEKRLRMESSSAL